MEGACPAQVTGGPLGTAPLQAPTVARPWRRGLPHGHASRSGSAAGHPGRERVGTRRASRCAPDPCPPRTTESSLDGMANGRSAVRPRAGVPAVRRISVSEAERGRRLATNHQMLLPGPQAQFRRSLVRGEPVGHLLVDALEQQCRAPEFDRLRPAFHVPQKPVDELRQRLLIPSAQEGAQVIRLVPAPDRRQGLVASQTPSASALANVSNTGRSSAVSGALARTRRLGMTVTGVHDDAVTGS